MVNAHLAVNCSPGPVAAAHTAPRRHLLSQPASIRLTPADRKFHASECTRRTTVDPLAFTRYYFLPASSETIWYTPLFTAPLSQCLMVTLTDII